MKTKVLQVFYNENGLPFKDQERTVHFPVIGSGFMGASNTTQIKFYFKEIGDDAVKYVAVSKLPNGKVGSKVLENYYDSELDEPYALLELDSYYTQYKGDLFISLQGYQGGVQVTYDEDTELYEIEGTPTIQATGSIKFTNNYATQFVGSGQEENITLQQLLAIISDTVLRYYVNSANTLAEVFNEIGTKICAIDIEGDEYLCEMSGNTNIVLYDIHNQEWYEFTGANTTTIDEVMSSDNKQIIATKEDLDNIGNLFIYKGAASVSEINALTDIGNGWAYNLTDSGTLTLGNLQVETGDNVAFNGTIWTKLSSETVLGQYYTKEEGQELETQVDNRLTSMENQVQQVVQGSPKGVYATLSDLETAYPTGADGIYVVSADGHWYYWNGNAWTDGGVYLSTIDAVPETRKIAGIDLVDDIGSVELTEELKTKENYIAVTLTSDKYISTNSVTEIGQTFVGTMESSNGSSALIINNLVAGTKYKIKGKGNSGYFKTYVLTDSDNKVTRYTTSSTTDVILTIASNEVNLYVNLYQYNSLTDGVWRIDESYLIDEVNENTDFRENISTEKIYKSTQITNLIANAGWNLLGVSVGSISDLYFPTEYAGVYCTKVYLKKNCKYIISGKGGGGAFLQYGIFDRNQKLLYKTPANTDTRGSTTPIELPEGACYILINFNSYDNTKDYVIELENISLNDIGKPLKNKNIVFFGDSVSMFKDFSLNAYPDYFRQFSYSNVYNIAIGGTRLTQRATPVDSPTSSNESFAALDLVSLVDAIVAEDFSKQEAAASWIDANAQINYWNKCVPVIETLEDIDFGSIDAIVILIGTNDWRGNVSVGSTGDNNKNTFIGAINYVTTQLLTKYPNTKLYWFTPVVRWEGGFTDANWCDVKQNTSGYTLKQFVDLMEVEVKKQHTPVCNLYQELGWNKSNFTNYFRTEDGVHPYKGFRNIALKVQSFILANKTFGED